MSYVIKRIGYAILIMFLASLVTFAALRVAPGSAVTSILDPARTPPEVIERYKEELGLNLPIWQQYVNYMANVLRGNFGTSLFDRRPVFDLIADAALYTVVLAFAAFVLAFGLGVPAGVIAALNRGGWFDRVIRWVTSAFMSIPNFVLALLLVAILGVKLRFLPVSGASGPANLILPALVLAADPWSLTTRVTRTAVVEQLGADYTRTLRARGVSRTRINWRHVLRNALTPVVSLGSVQIRTLLGYTLIVEVIFRWPGMGSQLVQAILKRDYPVASALALLLALVVVIASTVGDLLLRAVDPRIRSNQAVIS
ncbi:MAG: ABC transporter permease [Actinobacteria bacterium]|nr:ABC transporter permease [Actinomycetota bacterium]